MLRNKVQLRNEMKKSLASIQEHLYRRYCEELKEKLVSSEEWKQADTIGITISVGREVETREIIETAWHEGKKIAVPKCFPDQKLLQFYQITSFDEVEDSFYSLKEPITSITPLVEKKEIDLLIVPGLVFDLFGYRIGFGGGYYDRFLVDYPNKTVSLALKAQIIEEIPRNSYDIPINKIMTHT